MQVCTARNLNIAWIDETHSPDKVWLVHVIATLDPTNEIFRKDYVPPPIRKRLKDIETIVLPNELFEGLPKSTSKNKSRRLKVISEALATEKATRLKEIKRNIDDEIIEHEVHRDKYQQMQKPKVMQAIPAPRIRNEEEKKELIDEIWAQYDKDNSGQLSKAEMKQFVKIYLDKLGEGERLPEKQFNSIFASIDVNHDE